MARKAAAKQEAKEKITKDMTLGEVLTRHPETAEVMMSRGLHCVGCSVAAWETIEQGAANHGMSAKQITDMLKDMNKVAKKKKS